DIANRLANADRRDAMRLVVRLLFGAPTVRLVNSSPHALGQIVGVHDHVAVDVPRGAADRLNQRAIRAQVAFLVRIEDGDQLHLDLGIEQTSWTDELLGTIDLYRRAT